MFDGIEAFQGEFSRSNGSNVQNFRPTPNEASLFALDNMDGTNVPIESAKPKLSELPKEAYNDDFPTLSGREAANRWGGGTTKHAGGVPPKVGGPVPVQSLPTGPPPKSVVPAAKMP